MQRKRDREGETAEGAGGCWEKRQVLHMTSLALPPGAQTLAWHSDDMEI